MERYLLGIDVGTTGTKTLLFSETGRLCAHAYRAYPLLTPEVGRSEQNAEDWWRAVAETVREVCEKEQVGQQVAAISLSAQGGTVVPVDAQNVPLRPAIVWNDARCQSQRDAYLETVGPAETIYEKTGWRLGLSSVPLELRWLREQEPEVFAKAARFLTVPDYISVKMTGRAAVDLSNAGINKLCDIRKADYDETLMAFAGVTRAQLPEIVRSGEVIGHLTAQAAQELGLSTDAVLTAGAHDQYAVALGAGSTKAGDILIGSGTCWVVTAMADEPDFGSGLAQSVAAAPGMWGSLWSLSSGGVCLDWLRKNVLTGQDSQTPDYGILNEEAAGRKAAESGLFFFPFSGIAGDGKRFGKATFTGLDLSHDRYDMTRAVMEGVAFQVVWMMESFKAKPSQEGIKLAGGASKSALWCRILADISGLPVRIPEVPDLACVGAAVLAGFGCGLFETPEEGCRRLAVGEQVLRPDPERVKIYAPLAAEYRRQAAALQAVYGL